MNNMKDVFYNYDHEVDLHKPALTVKEKLDSRRVKQDISYLYNITGELVGLEASSQAYGKLFFYIDELGTEEGISNILYESTVNFSVYDHFGNEVLSTEPEVFANEGCIIVDIITGNGGPLTKGNYSMELTLNFQGVLYTLYSANDGVLYVR